MTLCIHFSPWKKKIVVFDQQLEKKTNARSTYFLEQYNISFNFTIYSYNFVYVYMLVSLCLVDSRRVVHGGDDRR